jgi:hypothetical protein
MVEENPMRHLYRTLLAGIVAAGTLVSAAAAQQAWEPQQKGVTWHWQSWQDRSGNVDWAGLTIDLNAMHQAGITWARMHIGPEMSDELISRLLKLAEARGVHFLVLIGDTEKIQVKESDEWLTSLVKLHGSQIRVWELSNEENNSEFWSLTGGRTASVGRYVDYERHAYTLIKGVDGTATVLMGGLMGYHVEQFLPDFMRLGGGKYTDGFNIHPYAADADSVVARLKEIESFIKDDPDLKRKPTWVTEIGYYDDTPGWHLSSHVADEATKAVDLTDTIRALRKHGVETPIFWYNFHDGEPGVCGYSLTLFDHEDHEVALPAYWAYHDLPPVGPGKQPKGKAKAALCP